ncbi:DUF6338 family protein [Ruegeria sp. Ofav3-42]|uniref:DUF6338 family protein n=1 Tax=Ruegeria sp. Ofav3-42 TaxID=2917759 RepID=UPI001EF58384|nr:DUF6338 family protein [Ruegeria sp. Ofav3-42]MCG7520690.1 DUF6338 family protein [Ruegeria sp. Ofav3-42]
MVDLKSPEAFQIVLYLVVPGLIAVFVRAQFLTGRMQKHTDAILTYLPISLIYWAMVMIAGLTVKEISEDPRVALLTVFLGPAILGALLGLNARLDLVRGLLRKAKLNPVHPVPTAWDWKFQRTQPQFVLVTMTDGECVAGRYDESSFASSDPTERDIYIEKVLEIQEHGPWKDVGDKGILIRPSEIRYIEFFPANPPNEVSKT